jgi:hypothetical protein
MKYCMPSHASLYDSVIIHIIHITTQATYETFPSARSHPRSSRFVARYYLSRLLATIIQTIV